MGRALGQIAARWAALDRQRADLARELADLARSMAGDAASSGRTLTAELGRSRKGGRPKGFKTSEATKRKLRAAWRRRKAAMAGTKGGPG
jgi:hypothetical protein